MRKRFMVFAATAVVALLMALPAHSQSMLRADVPFRFMVGDTSMPAGEYEIVQVNQHLTLIRTQDGSKSLFRLTIPDRPRGMEYSEDAKLVFHRYGSRYFLAEIHTPWSGLKHVLPKGSLEEEIASRQQGEVTVAFNPESY